MEVENINQIADIYLWLDLYDKVNLQELVTSRCDIPVINTIANERVSINLYMATWNQEDFTKRTLFNFIDYLRRPTWLNIDCYCVNCKKDYAFNFTKDYLLIPESEKNYNSYENYLHKDIFFVTFLCSKCHSQEISFLFRIDEEYNLYKIWQNPSKIDLTINDVKKYERLLWEKYYKELKESMILNSHWFSIGAFVYLRRIFEYIILETFIENKVLLEVPDEIFLRLKMDQKIDLLKDYLPKFLVSHKVIYWILSKHIHELDKEECLKNYSVIIWWIELILDERIKLVEEKRKEEELSKWIGRISSSL
jgi:hypothetical protein